MQSFEFTPQGVCARKITFDLEDGLIHHLQLAHALIEAMKKEN